MKRFYIRFEILTDTGAGKRKHLYLYAYSEEQIRDMFKEYVIITVEETEPYEEPVGTTAWTSDGESVVTLQGPLKPDQVVAWEE